MTNISLKDKVRVIQKFLFEEWLFLKEGLVTGKSDKNIFVNIDGTDYMFHETELEPVYG